MNCTSWCWLDDLLSNTRGDKVFETVLVERLERGAVEVEEEVVALVALVVAAAAAILLLKNSSGTAISRVYLYNIIHKSIYQILCKCDSPME